MNSTPMRVRQLFAGRESVPVAVRVAQKGGAVSPTQGMNICKLDSASPNTPYTSGTLETKAVTYNTYSDSTRLAFQLQTPINIKNVNYKQELIFTLMTSNPKSNLLGPTAITGVFQHAMTWRISTILQSFDYTTLTWNILNGLSLDTAYAAGAITSDFNFGAGSFTGDLNINKYGALTPICASKEYPALSSAQTIYGFVLDVKFSNLFGSTGRSGDASITITNNAATNGTYDNKLAMATYG